MGDETQLQRKAQAWRTNLTARLSLGSLADHKEVIVAKLSKADPEKGQRKEKKVRTQDALAKMHKATKRGIARIEPIVYKPSVVVPGKGDEEAMVVMVSDIQLGHKTPTTSLRIVKNRAARLASGVVRISQLHKQMYPVPKLYVFLLGDYVQNLPPWFMNFAEMEAALYTQVYDHAIPILSGLIRTWAEEFEEVHIVCVRGNHGRQGGKMGDDNFNVDTIIHLTLEQMFAENKRITWQHDPKMWWQKCRIMRTNFLAVHGNQWKAWMNIPWYGTIQRAMRWQGSLPGPKFDAMLYGHWHVASFIEWNDVELICNGCFVSDDQFTVEQMGMASTTKQIVFGVHPRKGITFRYKLDLDR